MPLLQRLSKRVGCRIWDAIKAKLKELTGREKIDKTLVDYVFVLFDPSNSPQLLRAKLTDFLGDKTDPFVEWFAKVVSQVDNQVSKVVQGDKETTGKEELTKQETSQTEEAEDKATNVCLDDILPQQMRQERDADEGPPLKSESQGLPDEGMEDSLEASSIGRSRDDRDRDRADGSHDRQKDKDQGRRKAASRMLSKAAQDAVKSVQSVGAASSHNTSSSGSRENQNTVSSSEKQGNELQIADAPKIPESGTKNIQDETEKFFVEDSPETPPTEPVAQHITVVTRSGQTGNKRSFDEAMDMEIDPPTFHHNPVIITAGHGSHGAGNRFVYGSSQGALVVPEKEMEENEPMGEDSNSMPGLLVVMPATTHDPLSRIKLGDEDPMYGGDPFGQHDPRFRFNGNMAFQRAPFTHLRSHQSEYWEGPLQEDSYSGNRAKRPRKASATPIDPSFIMCRFLPKCAKRADVCPFYHPACRNGKFCRFGDSCVYDHSGVATPNANVNQLRTKKPICQFYPNCSQTQCQFLHKQSIPCSFGTYCRSGPENCPFLHPEDVVADGGATGNVHLQIPDYDDESEVCEPDGEAEPEQDASNLSYEEAVPSVQA